MLDLRISLQLDDKFSDWFELRRKIIEPSVQEINEKSDLKVSYKPLRKDRSINSIEFYIEIDSQIKMFENQERIKTLKKDYNKKINVYDSIKNTA